MPPPDSLRSKTVSKERWDGRRERIPSAPAATLALLCFVFAVPARAVAGGDVETVEAATRQPDSTPARIVYTPTAFVVEPGRTRLTLTDLVLFGVERSFDDLLQVDFQAAVPVYVVGGSLWVKSTVALGEHARVGGHAVGALAYSFDGALWGDSRKNWGPMLQVFAGGAVVSLGKRDLFANFTFTAAAFHGRIFGSTCLLEGCPVFYEPGPGRLLLPGAGVSRRVA